MVGEVGSLVVQKCPCKEYEIELVIQNWATQEHELF
jgi:hypothetical protein